MSQNVFTLSYKKTYYLKHPIKFFNEVFNNIRAAYWRVSKGFAPRDAYEFGYWFLDIIPQMLKVLSTGCGYPGDEKFPTPESWKNHLLSISNMLENARDEVREQKNEYYPAYMKELEKNWEREWVTDENGNRIYRPVNSEISNKYFARERQLIEEQDIIAEEALKLLASVPLKRYWD